MLGGHTNDEGVPRCGNILMIFLGKIDATQEAVLPILDHGGATGALDWGPFL